VEDVRDLPAKIKDFACDGDVFVVMGAGTVSRVPAMMGEQA
jgi:UDP-N-acetylmuramate--alanine ligase